MNSDLHCVISHINIFIALANVILIIYLLSGCGGSTESETDGSGGSTVNTAPVSSAGSDQSVQTNELVTLDASGSSDSDGDSLTYTWSINSMPSNSAIALSNSASVSPTFTPDLAGDYVLSLIVNDGTIPSSADTVAITATQTNTAPTANAGSDQNVETTNLVTLSGTASSDPENDSLTYLWSFASIPTNSNATLSGASSLNSTFIADLDGEYVLSLVVNDGEFDSEVDQLSITASTSQSNTAPVANAGIDQSVNSGDLVNLDGSASSDADGDSITYSWSFDSQPASSSANLDDASSDMPSFTADVGGEYSLSLVVNDGQTNSPADQVVITVTTVNSAPTANAGIDIQISKDTLVNLDASASSDNEGDSLTYSWTIDTAPAGSTASMSDSTNVSPSFTADVAGQYVFSLIVNDGTENSNVDLINLTTANWLINNSERSTFIVDGGTGTLVNVQSVSLTTVSGEAMLEVQTTGIPNYQLTMTQADIDVLNARPRASSDFNGGVTSAIVGDVIDYGEDIGFDTPPGCDLGYWPPGPACPSDQSKIENLPVKPIPATEECDTGLDTMGFMLNGTAVYNWEDGQSYNNQRVWSNIAPIFEFYDVDMCLGHAQQAGDYHHHMFSSCLQDLFSDTGDAHSPIYGYSADGYPIYGPYHADGVLAKSSWVTRDYDDVNSESGCGVAGERTCQLIDPYDLSAGVVSVSNGPTTSESVSSLSSNTFITTSGHYFEDYYFDADLTALGNEYLDKHNGHEHDNFGYHYHMTVIDNSGTLEASFPYNIGPTFYGNLPSGAITTCQ